MPWYAITTLNIQGTPAKREVLFRDDRRKVWNFIEGRIKMARIDFEEIGGFYIAEAEADETWDFDIDEPRYRGPHAEEVPLISGTKL
jgi:hypothetical protein